ncbi:MAG: 23S rRNA (adenine(2503)-C(2))-methyltransferase RlmN [Fuerstiella sp.]|nr:23S rRNA (adenine(2503)-C(2))-methyltransferase RlmN [Fuerstiella sp.]
MSAFRKSTPWSAAVSSEPLPILPAGVPNHPEALRALLDTSESELLAWLDTIGEKKFRAGQIRRWMIERRIQSFEQMTDLSTALRRQLAEQFSFSTLQTVRHQIASDRTEKLLLRLQDGELVECVLMRDPGRRTVCISTQVGCAMGCVFCASGLLGVKRDLTAAEIFEQVLVLHRLMEDDEKITNVVVMGIGEPLANYKNLMQALDVLCGDKGFGLGARRVTVSTVGLPKQIRLFARCGRQFNLAVSLHAPNDELRTQIVPVNKGTGLTEILAAADDYFEVTGRRVSYEYVLLAGVNDQPHHAEELSGLLRGRNCHVNLIPMNGVTELVMTAPGEPRTHQFCELLKDRGIPATVRKRKGADIDAACGQLRLNRTATDAGGESNQAD